MDIIICLDYSSYTEHVLKTVKKFTDGYKGSKITVIHIIDEMLFTPTTGYEIQLDETINEESAELKRLCTQYLGHSINYIEECGIPKLKIDELLAEQDFDLLIVGNHSRQSLGRRLVGSVAEHLLRNVDKPILIIP